jgi:N-methylhydantoinase A
VSSAGSWLVSIDAGGTFTDAVAHGRDGETLVAKVPSSPSDPSQALTSVLTELARDGLPLDQVALLCHGTTVATNAMLTGEWADATLVCTAGFRDVLAYRNGSRPDVYSLTPKRPVELIPRSRRIGAVERIGATGEVITALSEAEIDRVVQEVVATRPESVAISLLFSYVNDHHERLLADALRAALPGIPVSISSEVVREFREYPRTATTAINATLQPVVGRYLNRAVDAVRELGMDAAFVVMQSNGGCVPATRAAAAAHRLILSGPAGGVTGLMDLAERTGAHRLISLDMGGTSTDICLVRDERIPIATSQRAADHEVLAPTVDIHTIGSGGGSIAWVDSSGRLRVGPQSAKAVPGPAAYGLGGDRATLTDAHVVLGTLGQASLASNLQLDRAAAHAVVGEVGELIGMSTVAAAQAIIAVSVAQMVRAVRKVSIERGLDPREFTLVPFGGAGPLHAGLLLRHLGVAGVIIPSHPGLFSAEGLLSAGLRIDDSQTLLTLAQDTPPEEIVRWFEDRSKVLADQLVSDGIDAGAITMDASIDCRYLGQGYELSVPLAALSVDQVSRVGEDFADLHQERYGHANRAEPVELVTLRIAAHGKYPHQGRNVREATTEAVDPAALIGMAEVTLPGAESTSPTPVYDRSRLVPGNVVTGPAVIHQMDATSVVLDEQYVTVLEAGELMVKEVAR